jgi:hypothetical protein
MTRRDQRERKWRTYGDTVLEFAAGPVVDLREPLHPSTLRALAEAGLKGAFAVLTAENPDGEHAEEQPTASAAKRQARRNEQRKSELEEEVERRGLAAQRVDGVSPDGDHRERCLAISADRDAATELARRFEQLAFFFFDGETFWLCPGVLDEIAVTLPDRAHDTSTRR